MRASLMDRLLVLYRERGFVLAGEAVDLVCPSRGSLALADLRPMTFEEAMGFAADGRVPGVTQIFLRQQLLRLPEFGCVVEYYADGEIEGSVVEAAFRQHVAKALEDDHSGRHTRPD